MRLLSDSSYCRDCGAYWMNCRCTTNRREQVMLKADLERLVEDQQATIEDLKSRKDVGEVYIAHNDPGEPVCYVGTFDDVGLSINIYRDENGNVQGVTVWSPDNDYETPVAVAGTITIPAEYASRL